MQNIKLFFLLFIISSNMIAQNYYGIKYAEKAFEIESLDPINSENTWRQYRFQELFHSRLWYRDEKLQKQPDLVESLPDKSNSSEILLKIKDDAYWQDGQPITTDDIIFTFNLYRDSDRLEFSKIAKKISIEKISDKSFKMIPYDANVKSFFKTVMEGIPNLYMLPRHIIGSLGVILPGDEYSKKPLGGGMFKIDSINTRGAQKTINMSRNGYHYYAPPPMNIEEIQLTTEPIMTNMINNFKIPNNKSYNAETKKKKGLDLLVEEISSIVAIRSLKGYSHAVRQSYEKNSWVGLAFNTRKSPLDSKEFRVILDEMIHDQEITFQSYQTEGRDITGPFHPSFGIYKEGLLDRYESDYQKIVNKLENLNIKKIDNMLHILNKNNGEWEKLEFRIIFSTLFVQDGSREHDALKLIQESFEEYGISIILDGLDREVFNKKIQDPSYWDLAYRKYEFSWDNNIWPLFNPDNTGHLGNITGYNNPVLSDLFRKFKNTTNVRAKIELGERIHEHCYENLPYLFLWSVSPHCFYRNIVHDLSITPLTFFTTIKDWTIEPR